jgi:hypothetical protein
MSVTYGEIKKSLKIVGRPGWFRCQDCAQAHEVIRIDHIVPLGRQPDALLEFGPWLLKLFCGRANLQGLCMDCYKEKNKADRLSLKKEIQS